MKRNLHLAAAALAAIGLTFSSLASAQDAVPVGRGGGRGGGGTGQRRASAAIL